MTENNAAQPGLNDTIRAVFLEHGFTIKHGQTDLKPYVYEAVHALLSKLRAEGVQAGDERAMLASFGAADCREGSRAVGHSGPENGEWEDYIEVPTKTLDRIRAALASAPVAKPKRAPLDDWRVQAIAECLETEWDDMTPASAEADARLIVGYLIAYEKESDEIEARHDAEPVEPIVQAIRNLRASAPVVGESVCKGSMALGSGCGACERCKAELQTASAPVAVLSDADIREVFLAHGFTIKDGQADLKPYVYEAARALIAVARIAADADKALGVYAARESAPVANAMPIRLSTDVLEYLKEGIENATGCDDSDVDHDFANELERLMTGPLYTEPLANYREVEWGPLVVAPVAGEAVCKTCGGSRVDPGGLPVCRDCDAAPQASEAGRDAGIAASEDHMRPDLDRGLPGSFTAFSQWVMSQPNDQIYVHSAQEGFLAGVEWGRQQRAALSAQPGAQEGGSDAVELVCLRDMLEEARAEIELVRESLGVPYEPHQTLFDRILDACDELKSAEAYRRIDSARGILEWLNDDCRVVGMTLHADRPGHWLRSCQDGTVKSGELVQHLRETINDEDAARAALSAQPSGNSGELAAQEQGDSDE